MKRCIHCKSLKPLIQFHVKRNGQVGARCKRCTFNLNAAAARFRNRNRQRLKEEMASYRKQFPEVSRSTHKRYYQKHRKAHAQHSAAYYARKRSSVEISIRPIKPAEWDEIKRTQRNRCFYCGEKKPLTQDHVIPISRGGRHERSNIVGSCRSCNGRKGSRPPEDFARQIGRLLI